MIEIKQKTQAFKKTDKDFHVFAPEGVSEACIWSLHGHEFCELEMFIEGTGTQVVNGEFYEIKPGTIHLITPKDFHEMHFNKGIKTAAIRFSQMGVDSGLVEKIFSANQNLVFQLEGEEREMVQSMLKMACKTYETDNALCKDLFIKNILESVIIMLLRKTNSFLHGEPVQKNHVFKAIAYLEMHFREDPDLKKVADYVGLNKNYFSSLFRQETGKSFVRYVTDLKLEYGRNLVLASDMSINEICFCSGFNSYSNFAREFKMKYGKTPLSYRKESGCQE